MTRKRKGEGWEIKEERERKEEKGWGAGDGVGEWGVGGGEGKMKREMRRRKERVPERKGNTNRIISWCLIWLNFSVISFHGKDHCSQLLGDGLLCVFCFRSLTFLPPLGRWEIEELREDQVPGDRGLVLKSKAKHHAISAVLEKPFIFSDKPLIVQ